MIKHSKKKAFNKWTFIDLFSGIGGFRLALDSFGAKCVFSCEWDKFASETYRSNYKDIPAGDITKINEKAIPKHDILCAGFPCQPFSISGKQIGFNDPRGTLFFDIKRIVAAKKPKIIILENVKNIVKHNNGKTFRTIKTSITKLGYDFYWKILNAANYGVPQNRERVYIVCFRKDLRIKHFNYPEPIKLKKHVVDILEKKPQDVYFVNSKQIKILKNTSTNTNKPIKIGFIKNAGQGDRIYSPKGTAITLSASGGGTFSKTGGYLISGKTRKLTTRECARLMGFPDTFLICENKTQAYKQFGNAVVVDVLQYIILSINDVVSKV